MVSKNWLKIMKWDKTSRKQRKCHIKLKYAPKIKKDGTILRNSRQTWTGGEQWFQICIKFSSLIYLIKAMKTLGLKQVMWNYYYRFWKSYTKSYNIKLSFISSSKCKKEEKRFNSIFSFWLIKWSSFISFILKP